MIVVINTSDLLVIAHFPGQRPGRYICSFRKTFFSERMLQHVQLLPELQANGRSVYLLNDQQDRDIATILQKIQDEKGAKDVPSTDLQHIYIIELIHFITKLHQQAFPLVQPSVN